MKYTFQVIVREAICQTTQTVFYHSFFIPIWKIQQEFIDAERRYIEKHTLSRFLKNLLYELLTEREANGLSIDPPQKLNTVLHEILDRALPNRGADRHYLHLIIDIDHYVPKRRRRCHFFENITPIFVSICSSIDLLLLGLLNFSSMQYAQSIDGFWNMDSTTNFSVSLTSSVMGILWSLWGFFSGGEIVFLKETGTMLDKKCHQLFDWCQGTNPNHQQEIGAGRTLTVGGKVFEKMLKVLFSLALFNNVYQNLTASYTQLTSISNTITDHISLPASVFRLLQWCEVGFDHIDDPFLWATTFYFGFSVIEVLISRHFSTPALMQTESPDIDLVPDQDEQKTPATPALIDERRLSRLSRWTQNSAPNQHHYQPLAAEPAPQPESDPTSIVVTPLAALAPSPKS